MLILCNACDSFPWHLCEAIIGGNRKQSHTCEMLFETPYIGWRLGGERGKAITNFFHARAKKGGQANNPGNMTAVISVRFIVWYSLFWHMQRPFCYTYLCASPFHVLGWDPKLFPLLKSSSRFQNVMIQPLQCNQCLFCFSFESICSNAGASIFKNCRWPLQFFATAIHKQESSWLGKGQLSMHLVSGGGEPLVMLETLGKKSPSFKAPP